MPVEVNNVDTSKEVFASGFTLEDLFHLAVTFYQDKQGKAIHLNYEETLRLIALMKQATFGTFRPNLSPDTGLFDVVGNDRRIAWKSLGSMSSDTAKEEFIKLLSSSCPLFNVHVAAHKASKEEEERKRLEEEKRQMEEAKLKMQQEELARQQQLYSKQLQEQEHQIREALNQQTRHQFLEYVKQHHPNDAAQQQALLVQLQEQHFRSYMDQVYRQQLLHQQQQYQQLQNASSSSSAETPVNHVPVANTVAAESSVQLPVVANSVATSESVSPVPVVSSAESDHKSNAKPSSADVPSLSANLSQSAGPGHSTGEPVVQNLAHKAPHTANDATVVSSHINGKVLHSSSPQNLGFSSGYDHLPPIAAAQMWDREDIKEFKNQLSKDKDSVIKIGPGETVTVRVPTHEDGTMIFWEFATDSYDVGFGVYFEWTISETSLISVTVTESSDDEAEQPPSKTNPVPSSTNVASGSESERLHGTSEGVGPVHNDDTSAAAAIGHSKPAVDEIIPVYRRNSHEKVICGNHLYPGRGVYLLKFDNSYSLLRSKTLYYRVYYTK